FMFICTTPHSINLLSLHDALPICNDRCTDVLKHRLDLVPGAAQVALCLLQLGIEASVVDRERGALRQVLGNREVRRVEPAARLRDRKSTRLNSSHGSISYAVFCLK